MEAILLLLTLVLFVEVAVKTEVVEIALEGHLPVLAAEMVGLAVLAIAVMVEVAVVLEAILVMEALGALRALVLRARAAVAEEAVVEAEAAVQGLQDKVLMVQEPQVYLVVEVQALAQLLREAEAAAETFLAVHRVVLTALLAQSVSSGPEQPVASHRLVRGICK